MRCRAARASLRRSTRAKRAASQFAADPAEQHRRSDVRQRLGTAPNTTGASRASPTSARESQLLHSDIVARVATLADWLHVDCRKSEPRCTASGHRRHRRRDVISPGRRARVHPALRRSTGAAIDRLRHVDGRERLDDGLRVHACKHASHSALRPSRRGRTRRVYVAAAPDAPARGSADRRDSRLRGLRRRLAFVRPTSRGRS